MNSIEGYSYGIHNRNNSKTSELLRNQTVVNSAKLAGERSVVDSPSSHSLISLNEHVGTLEESTLTASKLAYKNGKSEGIKEGVESVINNHTKFKLYTKVEFDEAKDQVLKDVISNPNAYDLFNQDYVDRMISALIRSNSSETTPYTEGWFYTLDYGWLWTNYLTYPYFYGAKENDWLYFIKGNKIPSFYHYGEMRWATIK